MLGSWFFVYFFKRFRSFNAVNIGSVDQRALKSLAVKIGGLKKKSATLAFTAKVSAIAFGPGLILGRCTCTHFGSNGQSGRLFLRSPTLTASNYAAL